MSEPCSICGGSEEAHEELNHEHNLNGQLIPKSKAPKKTPQARQVVVGAIDIDLRRILIEKGLINNADFAALYHPGAGASGDREAGEAESSG